jgi:hypothetical protein
MFANSTMIFGSIPASTAELYRLFFIVLDKITSFLLNSKIIFDISNISLFRFTPTEVIASIG